LLRVPVSMVGRRIGARGTRSLQHVIFSKVMVAAGANAAKMATGDGHPPMAQWRMLMLQDDFETRSLRCSMM
jgi:hypothetical protein